MSTNGAELGTNDFQCLLSELESSPLFAAKPDHGSPPKNALPAKDKLPAMEATTEAGGMVTKPIIALVLAKKSTKGAEVGTTDLLESSPSFAEKLGQGQRSKGMLSAKETLPIKEIFLAKEATAGAEGMAKSFAGLFNSNRKLSDENRLTKFAVEQETLELGTNDLIDVRTKLGYCLVGYIADKFLGLQAIRALSKSWGLLFQLHDSGLLIFHFAQDDDRERVLAGGPYCVYSRPLLLKAMPDCFEFKEDGISLTPVWATLPSFPLECWHPNSLGKIGSRLGTLIAMD
ncbi:hypothetical protein Sango_2419200 [Sesamum angolense]|uniref:DUF4283 domain-containing protein n=1 Tax=Sesamum angolense TaxID=2727404 RepID=A0AAE1W7D8_9LAMI|nr:hypothetical protein Sango_2419200 [Sesamum angolense]